LSGARARQAAAAQQGWQQQQQQKQQQQSKEKEPCTLYQPEPGLFGPTSGSGCRSRSRNSMEAPDALQTRALCLATQALQTAINLQQQQQQQANQQMPLGPQPLRHQIAEAR
jgi:hypothetical protein